MAKSESTPRYTWPAEWTAENIAIASGKAPAKSTTTSTSSPAQNTPAPTTVSTSTTDYTDYMKNRKTSVTWQDLPPITAEEQQYNILPESVTGIKAPVTVNPEPLQQKAPIINKDGAVEPVVTTSEITNTTTPTPTDTKTDVSTKTETEVVDNTPVQEKAMTANDAFQILMKGGKLARTVDSAKWEAQYKNFQKINALSANSLAEMNIRWMIPPATMDKLALLNPQKWAEVNKLTDNGIKVDGINQSSERLYNKSKGVQTTEMTKSEELLADIQKEIMSSPPSIRDMRDKYLNDNETIKNLKVDLTKQDAGIEEMKDDIDKVYDDFRGQFPTLPKTYIMNMAATATRNLNQQLNTMIRERNVTFSEYQAEKENADAALKFDMEVVAEERADRTERLAYLSNMFNTAKSDEDWERSKEFELKKLEDARKYGDEQAIKEHERNLQVLEKWQEFQRQENTLQRDQAMEIVKMQMKNAGVDASKTGTDEDGRDFIVFTDTNSKTAKKVYLDELQGSLSGTWTTQASNGVNVNYGTDPNGTSYIDFAIEDGTPLKRGECGESFNDIDGREHPVANSYDSKAKYIIPGRKPQAGDAFVSNIGVKDGEVDNWHIGFVTKVNSDGSLEVQDSNAVESGKWSKRTIRKWDPIYDSITGYFPTKLTVKQGSGNTSLKDPNVQNAIRSVQNFSSGLGKGQEIGADLQQTIKDFGVGSQQVKDKVASLVDIADKSWPWESQMGFTMANDIIDDVTAYKQKYGDDKSLFGYSGDMQSKIDQIQNALGKSGIQPETKARLQMEQKILASMQKYRRAMTGAAASVLESEEYKQLFPSSWFGEEVSMAQLEWFRDMMTSQYEQKAKGLLWGTDAYNALMGTNGASKTFNSLQDSKFMTSNDNDTSKETPSFLQAYWGQLNPF